jgi:hypothetical protein
MAARKTVLYRMATSLHPESQRSPKTSMLEKNPASVDFAGSRSTHQ